MATRLTLAILLSVAAFTGGAAALPEAQGSPPAPATTATVAAPPAPIPEEKWTPEQIEKKEADDRLEEERQKAFCGDRVAKLKEGSRLSQEERSHFKVCTRAELAFPTSANIGTELVRTIAQVVVDKVERQGWVALREELARLAVCDPEKGEEVRYPNFCEVLKTATIQDLVSSPEVLLDAAAEDILAMLVRATQSRSPEAKAALEAIIQGGLTSVPLAYKMGPDVLARQWLQLLLGKVRETVATGAQCDGAWRTAQQSLWVAGMCFVERPAQDALKTCDLDTWIERCTTDEARAEKVKILLLTAEEALGKKSQDQVEAIIRLVFGLAEAEVDENPSLEAAKKAKTRQWLDSTRDVALGLVKRDWVRVVSGASRSAVFAVEDATACKPRKGTIDVDDCEDRKDAELKLLALLGAIGNYAATYKVEDPDKAQANREEIMHELVDRMVSRTSAERGAKFSFGGNLGLLGGTRTDLEGAQFAFPVQLGLGFGLQSYHSVDAGFHLMVTLLDLGQYVTFDNDALEVEEPDVESSVTLGLTIGAWVWNREVPLYISGYGGISPFVRASGDPTFQFGVVTGFYAPLLDFN